jgi:rfaE bifunctional protein nucleotidyltransferase chain/domain
MIRHNTGLWLHDGEHSRQDLDVVHEVLIDDCYFTRMMPPAERVIDIGAHIGSFARKWRQKCPTARIACVEACPENIDVLTANVGEFATVINAACTYEPGEVKLINSILAGGKATGGSIVATKDTPIPQHHLDNRDYWDDARPLRKVTLEDVMQEMGFATVDLLKLDCEGSEFSILADSPSLRRVAFICGEYHGCERWDEFVKQFEADWDYGHMHRHGGQGIFHLRNKHPVRNIVMTNGCFDLLGPHHVDFLKRARDLGDWLVVAINSDRHVREMKGECRPVYNEWDRASMLLALRWVDEVHVFDGEEALAALVKRIAPEVLVKGADYTGRPITGSEHARRVVLLPLLEGRGTTLTMRRIRA